MRDESTRSRHQGTERSESSHQPKGLAALLGGAALVAYAVYKGTSKSREPGAAQRHEPLPSQIDASVNIHNRPPQELYRFWRQLENLPRFMRHLESVHDLGNGRSHWVAKSPLKTPVEWDAETVDDREGQLISWRSVPGSEVYNAGTVLFEPAAGGRGSTVRVHLELAPPGGPASRMVARLLEPITRQQVHEDLRRFKSLMEAGEIPTNVGQPVGERGVLDPRNPL